jgi:hypothetical protein
LGLDTPATVLLTAAKSIGVDFSLSATIGRQVFYPTEWTLRRAFAALHINVDADQILHDNYYAEPFFTLLGATQIDSIDFSPYENATIIHDLNQPIREELRERFTLLHDGGTIEHVFNAPQAFKNCMEMVKVGGHFTQVTVANNFLGHGFWQISPELIFRIFSKANGFETRAVLLHEVVGRGGWYVVKDPDEVRSRVLLSNSRPTYILTIARRVAAVPIFEQMPQQSDYFHAWQSAPPPAPSNGQPQRVKSSRGTWWRAHMPDPMKRTLHSFKSRLESAVVRGFKQPYYRRIDEQDLLRGRL